MVHFSYDGVYCSTEERQGGGGLSLCSHVSELLDLEQDAISGQHDVSHNLELAFATVFGNERTCDKNARKVIDFIYRQMEKYRLGKSKTLFEEEAIRISENPLSNIGRSTTRFVRYLLKGFTAYLRNLPVFHSLIGKEYTECVLSNDNSRAKALAKDLEMLADGEL